MSEMTPSSVEVNGELLPYLPMERRVALLTGKSLATRTHGAALFVDISGFTPLTERLVAELGVQRGPEELILIINRVYTALIDEVHAYRGSVIAFAGDAITCWFDGDPGRNATAAALAMQARMREFRAVSTPSGEAVRLAMKASVTAGPASRLLVGDPEHRVLEVAAGETIARLAQGEQLARAGEVIVDWQTLAALGAQAATGEMRHAQSGDRFVVVSGQRDTAAADPWPALAADGFDEQILKQWLLPSVYDRLKQGMGHFLTELRPTVALFVRFTGIDFDYDDDAGGKLDRFIRFVQRVTERHGGTFVDLNVGDKGSYLYVNFGAPLTHENDADRAAYAALDLFAGAADFPYLEPLQIGISQGRMRAGAYGAAAHRTYGVLGDEVNMAARLMMAAAAGQILVSDSAARFMNGQFLLDPLPPRRMKGRDAPIQFFALNSHAAPEDAGLVLSENALPFVGRRAELSRLEATLLEARNGRGHAVSITGEAGMGKSRLVEEAIRAAQSQGFRWLGGECDSYGVNTSYLVWRPVWRQIFKIAREDPVARQIEAIEAYLTAIDRRLRRRVPLLGSVLNLPIPDNSLTRNLDARARKASLEGLLIECLQAEAATAPLLIVLEDCQWLDPLSTDLIESIGTAVNQLSLLLLLAYRPLDADHVRAGRFDQLTHHTEMVLHPLDEAAIGELAAAKFRQYAQEVEDISPALITKIVAQAEGNPFYAEELINYLHYRNIDPTDARAADRLVLPSSLHQLVLSRVDQLTEHQKITAKIASVVGRSFRASWLWHAFGELGSQEVVQRSLDALTRRELTVQNPQELDHGYLFRHAVTQGVAYESLPFAARQEFHERFARFIEAEYALQLDQYVSLLAYHFTQSSNQVKMREYLLRAGEAARHEYANESAIDYYAKLLPLLDGAEQIEILRNLGAVLQLVGRWDEADQHFQAALALAEEAGILQEIGEVNFALAEHFRRRGAYVPAQTALERAQAAFEEVDDRLGIARSLSTAGTLAAQQGHYALARGRYQQALDILRQEEEKTLTANVLNNMAIVARYQGDYERSRALHEEALAIRRTLGDPLSISTSLSNLGNVMLDLRDYATAQRYQEEALALRREVGDRWATANSLNNLANVLRTEHKYAAAQYMYEESLRINRQLGDRWALAYLLEDIGALVAARGDFVQAVCMVSAAEKLREEIGAPRSQAEGDKLERALQSAYQHLTSDELAAARAYGLTMGTGPLVAWVLGEQEPPAIWRTAAR